jgi:membrane-bound inhibitor of C-type lysozyme
VKRASAAVLLAFLMAAAWPLAAPAAERGDAPFVVTYRCDGDRWLAVAYPAYRDARTEPIRLTWEGRTVLLSPTRVGSGARYVNALASLEWWSKGTGGTLSRLSTNRPLLTGCVEA